MSVLSVIERRRRERDAMVDTAAKFAAQLPAAIEPVAAVVFGSVARGDFNLWSDIDLLVVARRLPSRALDRLAALGDPAPKVQALAWTPEEWRRAVQRGDLITQEALAVGVWVLRDPNAID